MCHHLFVLALKVIMYHLLCPRRRVDSILRTVRADTDLRIQKDRDACLFASFGCSSENGSDSWKMEGRGNPNPNPKGCFLPLICL